MGRPQDPTPAAAGMSQADGASDSADAPVASRPEKREQIGGFSASVTWSGAGDGCGTARLPQGNLSIPVGGAKSLGGCGVGANPEEMLLAAIGTCFVTTWAIFLAKLKVTYARPALRMAGVVGSDPAGGYRITGITIAAQVPSALLVENRADVEKTLTLAEKYCIVSRAVRASVPIRVEIEEV